MSISIMKFIDEYFGRIAVFIISIFKKPFGKKKFLKDNVTKNILFIKFWGIGSIILTSPAVSRVKAAYPDSKIFFLTLKNNSEICIELGSADEVITIDISRPSAFILDLFRKTRQLKKTRFDFVFDFEFYTYFSAVIISFLKCRRSFGFDNLKNNRKILFTDSILFNDNIHTKDNFLNLVKADEKISSAASVYSGLPQLKAISGNKNGLMKITVNVNASKLAFERRLPENNFIEIIDHITEKLECDIILTGSADEASYVRKIHSKLNNKNRVSDMSGKTSVNDLIRLISSSCCLITNDSGPLHIASALNIPVIAFFGPETPVRYGPLSSRKVVFYNNLKCSPCMSISNSKTVNCIYDSPKCMEQFNMKEVKSKTELFIRDLIVQNKNAKAKWSANI